MQVHWRDQWLLIPYQGTFSLLQGSDYSAATPLVLQLCAVSESGSSAPTDSFPPDVQALINEFPQLFKTPDALPPSRACNHTILLIPGAQPVFTRPYRYPPSMKDEIECHVNEMLEQGLI